MSLIYKNNQSCDVCCKSPARKTEGQGQWANIYLCKNHKKDNAGNVICNGVHDSVNEIINNETQKKEYIG